MVAQAVLAHHRAPRRCRQNGFDVVGIAAVAGLGDDGGEVFRRLRHRLVQQFRNRPEQFFQPLLRWRRQVVDADADHAKHDVSGLGLAAGQRPLRQREAGAGTQGAHERHHDFHVGQAHVIAHALHRFAFHVERFA